MVERSSMDYKHVNVNPSRGFCILLVLILAALIGVLAGFVAYALYSLISFIMNLVFFQRFGLTLPSLKDNPLGVWIIIVPVLGGVIVGVMAKYGSSKIKGHGIPEAMEAVLTNRSHIQPRVAILKPLSAAIAIGTGGLFGAEGPIIQTDGALGSLIGQLIHTTASERKVLLACGAAAGMAAMFGSAARATFTLVTFAFEITRDHNAILPLMLVCILVNGVAILLMRNSIMTEKLARRGLHIHQDYEPDVLQQVRVGEVMDTEPLSIPSIITVKEFADHVTRGDSEYVRHQAFPIVNGGQLARIIIWGDIVRALAEDVDTKKNVLEAGNDEPVVTYQDELLYDAVGKMLRNDVGRLPVVDRQSPHKLVGYLGHSAVMEARLGRLHEEHVLETGWLKSDAFSKPSSILGTKFSRALKKIISLKRIIPVDPNYSFDG